MVRTALATLFLLLPACMGGRGDGPEPVPTGAASRALGVYALAPTRTEHGIRMELLGEAGRSLGSIFAERTDAHRLLRITFHGVEVEHEDEGPGQPLELSTANALIGERVALLEEPLVAERLAELDVTFTTRPLQSRRADRGALRSVPQTEYNARTRNCSPYRVAGGPVCAATAPPARQTPLTEACQAAQWLWTAGAGYQSKDPHNNDKGNAYCSESPYWGTPAWGTYADANDPNPEHVRNVVVQEIAGLWTIPPNYPENVGCSKNIRVCLGTPEFPAVTSPVYASPSIPGPSVPGCGTAGNAGCAVCWASRARPDNEVLHDTDTCCTKEYCLLAKLSVDATHGSVESNLDGIDCTDATCEASYNDVAQVTLTRTDGFDDFTGWGGDCSGSSNDTCKLDMGVLVPLPTPPPLPPPAPPRPPIAMFTPVDHSVSLIYDLRGTYEVNEGAASLLPRRSAEVIHDCHTSGRLHVSMVGAGPYSWELTQGACVGLVSTDTDAACSFNRDSLTLRVTHVRSGRSREITVVPAATPPGNASKPTTGVCP